MVIDNLVRTYPAYKHDDIFNMSVIEVYRMVLLNAERAYLQYKEQEVAENLRKSKVKY